jgi:hypothetical protein
MRNFPADGGKPVDIAVRSIWMTTIDSILETSPPR